MPILGIIASSIQKAYNFFSDSFNRTTTGSLGVSSSGSLWGSIRGTWFANGSSATSNDSASTYPISAIDMASESSTLSISTGEGLTLISASGLVGSVASGNGTVGQSGFHWATITGMSSTTGISVGDYISAVNGSGSLYGGAPDFVEVTSIVSSSSITYRIKGGSAPVPGTVVNIRTRGKDGGSGVSLWITDSGNWFGVTYGRSIDTSCNCSMCLNGTYSCVAFSSSTSCNGWSSSCVGWSSSCNGWTSSCVAWNSSTTYSGSNVANYGQAVTGYWRVFSYTRTYTASTSYSCGSSTASCTGGSSTSCSSFSASCTGGTSTSYSCSSSAQNSSPCNCQTCYPPYISVIRSASNSVSQVTRFTLSSMAAAFKVAANATSKVLTISAYRDQGMTNKIGTDLTSNLSAIATPTKKFGIVLAASDQIQGKNLDDFNAETN
jgi:hypothetical protein